MRILTDLALRRPVAATAGFVLVLALAAVAWVRLPVSLLPDLRYPALAVWTAYADVPPERVERAVTERIEEAVAGTAGLAGLQSRSLLGGSLVRLDFGWNADLDLAALDVREQLDRLGGALPDEADRPAVLRLDPGDRPIMVLALREAARATAAEAPQDLVALKTLAREVVARRLEQLADVARVRVTGGFDRRIDVVLDPDRLAAHGVALDQIAGALRSANVALPGGMIRRGPFRYAVEVSGEFEDVRDVAATVVAFAGGAPIRLADLADVREAVEERRGLVRLDREEALLLLVERRPDANTVRAAEEVRAALTGLRPELPGARLDVVVDESVFVREAIGGVAQAVVLGGLLALVVLFAFLRRPRVLIAVGAAVPLSLAITLVLFDAFGVSFNLISLSGLALGVGMLVDNAIVVVENIARLREAGRSPWEAAREGTAEVAGAITAATFTTIAVFLPITFVEGLAGRLFRDQSLAVVFSLLASLVVALTAVPLLAAKDRSRGDTGPKTAGLGAAFTNAYEQALSWSLDHRAVVLGACAVLLGLSAMLAVGLPREVVPPTNQGRVEVRLATTPDADLPLLSARADAVERRLLAAPSARHVLADVGEADEARLDLDPRPPYEAHLTLLLADGVATGDALRELQALPLPPDLELEARQVQTQLEQLLATGDAALQIDLTADTRAEAEAIVPRLLDRLAASEALVNVARSEEAAVPAYRLTFDRTNMARYGVSPATLSAYLEAAARGRRATDLRTTNEAVPIVLRATDVRSLSDLLAARLPVRDQMLPLSLFVHAEAVALPAALLRAEQAPVVRLTADLAPDADLADAEAAIARSLAETLPPGVRGRLGGATDAFRRSLRALGLSLLLSILLVYLVLAAQFEHLGQPLVILLAVPLAAAGVVLALGVFGQSVNLMSLTGCVVLVGIVVNDAIVKVDFINRRRADGLPLRAAIVEAGRQRLRPIVMTTLTTMLGLLPLAFGLGAGGELQRPLALAICGGLLSATVLTLVVVPVAYSVTARGRATVS